MTPGLLKKIVDAQTGTEPEFHVIVSYTVQTYGEPKTTAILASFISPRAQRAVASVELVLPLRPPVGEDPVQWLYQKIIDAPLETGGILAGAKPAPQEA